MKVIIAGSRSITDYETVAKAIEESEFEITEVVSGTARGVDRLGEAYAKIHNIPLKQFPADWNGLGRYAGLARNRQMAKYADAAIIVWDGSSRGASDMIFQAKTAGLKTFIKEIMPTT